MGVTMNLAVYVNYKGTCEEAFRFYEQHLGGTIAMIMRHGEQPGPSNVPDDWNGKVLHARLEIGGTALQGADIPNAEPMRSAYLSLAMDSDEEADRVYGLLVDGGQVFVKMEENFFATRFATLRDRFGTSWMLTRMRSR